MLIPIAMYFDIMGRCLNVHEDILIDTMYISDAVERC